MRDTKGQETKFVIIRTGAIEAIKVRTKSQSHVVSVIREVGSTQNTSESLREMGIRFAFPKPIDLISYLVSMVADKSAIVLDSFAGTGTSAHAVLELNRRDAGNRRFILVQLPHESDEQRDSGYNLCEQLTAKRVRAAIQGYTNSKGEHVAGLGGGFRYCELGEPLFDEGGRIREVVSFADLARHVYFSETGEPLPRENVPNTPFLGACRGVGIYLLYNGILRDRRANGGNVLTRAVLAQLPPFDGQKVVYCAGCLLGRDRLQAERIIVRQTPYEIKIS